MEVELGKLFIGGISWDTNEVRLRDYFQKFGQVVEAVIMKDRNTGRARGFGFVVFADPLVAERVVLEKHVIDGRTVEAKKAVPRDDHSIMSRNSNSIYGSPGPVRTKKIFVGGLASTVTESDFKIYFDQFGMITDVVVMYDHNTQRPRGFGFITYDSEDAVGKVLLKTFHELNGKMVEVKRAVPKELSLGPSRNQLGSLNYSPSRVSTFMNEYTQGFNQIPIGSYGARIDGRFSPVTVGPSGYPQLSPSGYGIGLNYETGLGPSYGGGGGGGNLCSNLGYGRGMNPVFSGQSNRYHGTIGYGAGNVGNGSGLCSINNNLWRNQSLNYGTNSSKSDVFMLPRKGNSGVGVIGSLGATWSSPISTQRGTSVNNLGSLGYANEENLGSGGGGYARYRQNNVVLASSYAASNGANGDVFQNGCMYEDPTWQLSSSELEGSGPFGFGLPNASARSTAGFVDGYGVTDRESIRGIAA